MNHVKDALTSGKTVIGTTASASSDAAFLADSGFDFLLFDTQHSLDTIKGLQPALQAMRRRQAIPIVRVADNRPDQICFALDIGAKGLIVPMVNTPAEARDMVKWCRYPFAGARSSSGVHGEWGEYKSYREYMDAVNQQLLIIPMIETVEAIDNLDAIVSTPGVDVLLVGPSDLSINLGVPLDYTNALYLGALQRIATACKQAGIAAGMYFVPPGIEPKALIGMGFRFFTLPWAGWAKEGIRGGLASFSP